jgi:hypothetical protein
MCAEEKVGITLVSPQADHRSQPVMLFLCWSIPVAVECLVELVSFDPEAGTEV